MFKHVTASKTRLCEFLSTANRLFRYNVSTTFTIEIFTIIYNWSNHISHVDYTEPQMVKIPYKYCFWKMTLDTFSIVWRINDAILNGLALCLCAYTFFTKEELLGRGAYTYLTHLRVFFASSLVFYHSFMSKRCSKRNNNVYWTIE